MQGRSLCWSDRSVGYAPWLGELLREVGLVLVGAAAVDRFVGSDVENFSRSLEDIGEVAGAQA